MTKADTVQKAWDALGEPEAEAREPEQDPADMEMDELLRVMADGLRRDTGDVILSLYETIRSVAKAGGMEPGHIVQALYELDCVLERVAKA
ncbi:MAG: hypothetical protein II008_00150 [Oscillospiraceae bacterium]|nr:hypothetical protein [Oscillospiraceae bacterium]